VRHRATPPKRGTITLIQSLVLLVRYAYSILLLILTVLFHTQQFALAAERPPLKFPVRCFGLFDPVSEHLVSAVFPIAHVGMSLVLEESIQRIAAKFSGRPEFILETDPHPGSEAAACSGVELPTNSQRTSEKRMLLVDELLSKPTAGTLGMDRQQLSLVPAAVLYLLASDSCAREASGPTRETTEARITVAASRSGNQVSFLETATPMQCAILRTPEFVFLEAAHVQLNSCLGYLNASRDMISVIGRSKTNGPTKRIYESRLSKLGDQLFSSVGFQRRHLDLQARIEEVTQDLDRRAIVFIGAYHMPDWLVMDGLSPKHLQIRDLCR
jgi:hypothetical protein